MINIDAKKLQTETTGEKIVHQLQDYLLQHTSADERAVLPEDKIQRLLVGISLLFFFKTFSIPTEIPSDSSSNHAFCVSGL